MKWTPTNIYKEIKSWALAAMAAGALTLGASIFIEPPPTGKEQCDVALQLEARYAGKANLTPAQTRLLADANRELDECMK